MTYFYCIPTDHQFSPDFAWERETWSEEDKDNWKIWEGDMLGILVDLGLFVSRSQARAVGWGTQIPWGYHQFFVGKKRTEFVTIKPSHIAAFKEEGEPEYVCSCGLREEDGHAEIPCPSPANMKCYCKKRL